VKLILSELEDRRSRIICYCIDKMLGSDDCEKTRFLISRGLIPRERRDEREKLLT